MLEAFLLPDGGEIPNTPMLEEQPNYTQRLQNTLRIYQDTFISAPPTKIWDDGYIEVEKSDAEGDSDPSVEKGEDGANLMEVVEPRECQLKIRLPSSGVHFVLPAMTNDTVGELKEKIEEQHGMYARHQILVQGGRELGNDRTIAEFTSLNLDVLLIPGAVPLRGNEKLCSKYRGQKVNIRCANGSTFQIGFDPYDSVESVKSAIEDSEGIPAHQQRVMFCGQQIKNGRTMSDYNIQDGGTIHLVVVLTGRSFRQHHA